MGIVGFRTRPEVATLSAPSVSAGCSARLETRNRGCVVDRREIGEQRGCLGRGPRIRLQRRWNSGTFPGCRPGTPTVSAARSGARSEHTERLQSSESDLVRQWSVSVRIPAQGRGRRYRWGLVALVLLVVACLLAFGYHRFVAWRDRPSEARRIAEAATVVGFTRTAVVDISDSSNRSDDHSISILTPRQLDDRPHSGTTKQFASGDAVTALLHIKERLARR